MFGGKTLILTEKPCKTSLTMKDTLLPCLLPVLGRKFAVRLQICPTKVFLLCMQTDQKRGLLLNQLTSRFLFFLRFVLFFSNIIAEHFLHDLKERESFYLGKKNNNSRHTNYDSSSPLKYTHTRKKQNKTKTGIPEKCLPVYFFISRLFDRV